MRIAEINMYTNFSTGKIMMGIAKCVRAEGNTVITFSARNYTRGQKKTFPPICDHFYFGSIFENMVHAYMGKITGMNGFFSRRGTKNLIAELDRLQPDIVHIHNIHDFCVNYPILFGYLKKKQIKTVWTLHDCWAFTGHCPAFVMANCEKWRTGCHHCPQLSTYPRTCIDNTKYMWKRKKKLFSGLNMTIVTPSNWLAGLVKQSFLSNYPVKVINNGIDLSIFHPASSDFREIYGLRDKKIVLGVAASWGRRKGLDVFVELSRKLDERYQIILVGTDDRIDETLPPNIISIHRTQDQTELASLYATADLFVNPTREDNYPTVNMEALACGTPVVTFDTGGSPEILDKTCGSVVFCGDIDELHREIARICEKHLYPRSACIKRAERFDLSSRYKEYLKLYEDCTHSTELPV